MPNNSISTLSNIKYSSVTEEGGMMNVFTSDDHTLHCVFDDVPYQTAVSWPVTQETGMYEIHSHFTGLKQHSSLTIKSAKLTELRKAGQDHTFTCRMVVGKSNTPVVSSEMLMLYTPSKCLVSLNYGISSHHI